MRLDSTSGKAEVIASAGGHVPSLAEDSDGELYIITYGEEKNVFALPDAPKDSTVPAARLTQPASSAPGELLTCSRHSADVIKTVKIAVYLAVARVWRSSACMARWHAADCALRWHEERHQSGASAPHTASRDQALSTNA